MLGRKSAANINPSEKSHSYHRVSVQQSDCGLQLMTLPRPGTVRSWSGSSGEGDSSQGTGGHADTTASLESNQEISVLFRLIQTAGIYYTRQEHEDKK